MNLLLDIKIRYIVWYVENILQKIIIFYNGFLIASCPQPACISIPRRNRIVQGMPASVNFS